MVEGAAEAAEVQQAFRCAIEGDAHAIEQIDDGRRGLAHVLDRRLIGEEIATVDGVVKVLPGGVAFAFKIFCCVDSALSAYRVRALYWDDREQIDGATFFRDLDHGREPGESAAHHDDLWIRCHYLFPRGSVGGAGLVLSWSALASAGTRA